MGTPPAPRPTGLRTVAVTGTNGKTTTTSMIAAIVAAAGEADARVTTVGHYVRDELVAQGRTMAAFERARRAALAAGARTLALEVTSTALGGGFAERHPPDVAVFTNLGRDHLDRHGTVERYLAAKARLFLALPPGGTAVLNAADPAASLLREVVPPHARTLGFAGLGAARFDAALVADRFSSGRGGTEVALSGPPGSLADRLGAIRLRVLGDVHVDNALAAALAADAAGYAAGAIRAGLERFGGVPGRLEPVARSPLVLIDFAHTPEALRGALRSAAGLAGPGGRVRCVFGCGGDRDAGKRASMGAVADAIADHVILTTDNPRSEDPAAIAEAVARGARGRARWERVPDRADAIRRALAAAAPPDVVVVAGKGHERHQEIGSDRRPFDDAAVAREACAALGIDIA